ncbi:putative EF-hand domain-containing protein [Helianthus annuus]|nr:putative EF-hand domain-containing protein [Helianthus annuus]KAJ0577765.1 putative EF-hand domain-containing protein [Helianthus annuus]KAJ0585148.1 putative EF-hand domain-containing protein [Helianthus annuus]KAJ0747694.1 putative EF-hand domain-containing protein [Helianthus annuus]KAJ0919631.1 putative EF-hand domain-containing protein [Helianthus annuus]
MVHMTRYKTGGRPDGKTQMTMTAFKKFIDTLDTNKDGVISAEELSQAVRKRGGWFATWKGNRALKSADANDNGYVDEDEIPKLVAFAEKELNVVIVEY